MNPVSSGGQDPGRHHKEVMQDKSKDGWTERVRSGYYDSLVSAGAAWGPLHVPATPSFPKEVPGVPFDDMAARPRSLDGHAGAQNSHSLDLEFARNSAVDPKLPSLSTNWEFFTSPATSITYDARTGDVSGEWPRASDFASVRDLMGEREYRVLGMPDGEYLVGPPTEKVGDASFLTRDYSGQEVGMIALGAYAAFSLLAR